MKKYFYFIAMLFVVAISIFNVINLRVRSNVSQMRLANIEALSDEGGSSSGSGESSNWGCAGHVTYIPYSMLLQKPCPIITETHKVCSVPDGHIQVCCNPAEQTDCKGKINM